MLKMSQIDIINAYKTLTKIPAVTGGKLNNAANRISAKWSVRNLDKGKNTSYATSYTLDNEFNVIAESDFGTDISNEILSAVSPRETFRALIREEKNGKDAKKQYLEVWSKKTLAHSVDLTSLDKHGDVYADSEFGSLDWSHDETALVYIAEKKQPKYEPYIKRKDDKPKADGSGETAPVKGEEFVYRQDWGEQLVGKIMSVVVVFKLSTESLTVLDGIPEDLCPGQVRFTPDGNNVVGVVWKTEPRRLGLIFCTNRLGYIFKCNLTDGTFSKLTGEGLAVRSPRFTTTGDLVWLQRKADGPHHACQQLKILKTNANEAATLIDIVDSELKIVGGSSFHGVYCQALASRCSTAQGDRILLSSPQKNEVRSYVVNIGTGDITDISNKSRPCSTSILDVRRDVVLAACSSLTSPGQLYIARLPPQGEESTIVWNCIGSNCDAPDSVKNATVEYLDLQHEDSQDSVKSFTALYFAPNAEGKKLPLIVWPHGGPHSNFVNAYSLEAALFNMLGFAALQINFRGSTGAGQASVHYLLNRVGDADVKDCKLATDRTLATFPINEKHLCLFGGSHGGFLVTHLSGQYPDVYCAVVSRNPVTDIASMFNSTDIADWCAAESGFEFTEKGPVSEEQLLAMRRCSPIAHVHKVKAPTVLMLGSGDKRVPHFQGLDYARRLKANGVPTRIYMYDDNHSLSSAPAEMDNLINSARWFLEHLH